MSFLSPLMLLGILGAAIPIAVHLQGRRKAKVVPFAALEFLLGTDKRIAKRLVLRQMLVLAFRVLVCASAALILARPYASCQSDGPNVARGPQAAVLIVDNSATAGYELSGRTLLSRSLESAGQLMERLGPEAEIAILTTTGGGQQELSRDHLGLRETLSRTPLRYHKADATRALQRAVALLSGTKHERNTIFLLTAPTKATLPATPQIDSSIAIRTINPAEDAQLPNLAVTDVQVQTDTSISSHGLRIVAKVANFSTEQQTAKLSLRLGGEVVARGQLTLAAGQTNSKQFSASVDEQFRSVEVSVALQEDALPADNTRYAVGSAGDRVAVLLVNGDARSVRHEDELYYVDAALRPGDRSDSGTTIVHTTPDDLGTLEFSDYDVIVLANVPVLPAEHVQALSAWVAAGGGLMVSMGTNVDADAYNRSMTPLLAQSLRSPLDLRHGRKNNTESNLRLSKLEFEHPVFSVFTKDAPGLYSAAFWQVMLLGPTTNVKDRKVLARFDNGAAALVEARSGAGLLMLFSSTLDRDWNDVAIHPGFLPFLQQSIRYLASKPFARRTQQALVGDSVSIKVTADDMRIEIEGPGHKRIVLEGDQVQGRKSARLDSIDVPGIYRATSFDSDGEPKPRPDATFAANVDPAVSDLSLGKAIERQGERGVASAAAPTRRIELWHSLAAFLLLLLLMESGLGLLGRKHA